MTLNNTYAKIEREFDDAGNAIVERYYGKDGERIPCKDGYDETHREYNDLKQAIRFEYWLNGEITSEARGYAIMLREYDEAGLVAAESYYDEHEIPMYCRGGYHRVERTWLDKNHATSEAWFDAENHPMAVKDTYVKIEREFDQEGNVIAERYYGADGKKIPCMNGYDEVHRTADGAETYYLNGEEYIIPEEAETEDVQETENTEKEDAA